MTFPAVNADIFGGLPAVFFGRCSARADEDTYPESYITEYTQYTKLIVVSDICSGLAAVVSDICVGLTAVLFDTCGG